MTQFARPSAAGSIMGGLPTPLAAPCAFSPQMPSAGAVQAVDARSSRAADAENVAEADTVPASGLPVSSQMEPAQPSAAELLMPTGCPTTVADADEADPLAEGYPLPSPPGSPGVRMPPRCGSPLPQSSATQSMASDGFDTPRSGSHGPPSDAGEGARPARVRSGATSSPARAPSNGRGNARGRGARARGGGRRGGRAGVSQTQNASQPSAVRSQFVVPGDANAPPWASLDTIVVASEFKKSVPTMKDIPDGFRGPLRAAFHFVLQAIVENHSVDAVKEEHAWKLLLLLPRLLLRPTTSTPEQSHREILRDRLARFWAGDWLSLLAECQHFKFSPKRPKDEGLAAQNLIKQSQLSKAAALLTSPGLAPPTEATKTSLANPDKRPRWAYEALPEFAPTDRFALDREQVMQNIRSIKKGSSPGRAGLRGEHLRLLLDTDSNTFELLCQVLDLIANADIPTSVKNSLAVGSLTPFRKVDVDGTDKGVRGICTGHLLRRLIARTLAQKHREEIETATAPEQLAMGSRSGVDLATLTARAALELDPELVLLSIDGVGAFDHISRKSMFQALNELPNAREMIPFLRIFYGQQSTFLVSGFDDGFEVSQGEGGEQGDALMPALFSLGLSLALREARADLQEGETAFAFLDDVYLLVKRENARAMFDRFSSAIFETTRVHTNLGKIRCWGAGVAEPPPGIAELGTDV